MTQKQENDFTPNYTCTDCGRKGGYRKNNSKSLCQRCINSGDVGNVKDDE